MKKLVSILLIGVVTVVLATALGASSRIQNLEDLKQVNENAFDTVGLFPLIPVPKIPVPDLPLPKSLDKLFPPKAPGPIWLFEMLEMGENFISIPIDLSEN